MHRDVGMRELGAPQRRPHTLFTLAPDIRERRAINGLLPISRLPPELVIHIMRIAASFPIPEDIHKPWALVVVTQVYHHWRAVALSTPSLWCNIVLLSPRVEHLEEWLKRSKGLPVFIAHSSRFWKEEDTHTVALTNVLKDNWRRLRALVIRLSAPYVWELNWPRRLQIGRAHV